MVSKIVDGLTGGRADGILNHFLLFTVYCLLFTVYCLLFTVYCLLFTVYCLLFTVYCLLFTVYSIKNLFSPFILFSGIF